MDFSAFTQNNNSGSLNLQKEGVLNLTKQAPQITRYILGGGWDMAVAGPAADLDLSSFLLNANGQVEQVPQDVIFFNNKKAQGIYLEGDNRTGQGDGDDERIQKPTQPRSLPISIGRGIGEQRGKINVGYLP